MCEQMSEYGDKIRDCRAKPMLREQLSAFDTEKLRQFMIFCLRTNYKYDTRIICLYTGKSKLKSFATK